MAKRPAPPAPRGFLDHGAHSDCVWTEHNLRTIRAERLQTFALGLAWLLAGMLSVTLLTAIARYALARAADAATLAPSMMMF